MKKLILFFNVIFIGAFLLTSCELNEIPEFSDADAFASFTKTSMAISEQGGTLNIPVTVASIEGLSTTVTYQITDGTASNGTNFTPADGSGTLSFDANNRTSNIVININDLAGVYTGDLKFTVELVNSPDVSIGADNVCEVTINDEDHPLAAILGNYTASGTSYFDGPDQWTMTFLKDPDDESVVWIENFVKGGSSLAVYGVVNEDMTEIKVPAGQRIAESSSYGFIELVGFYGPDGADAIPEGANITIKINPDYSMEILDEIGSYVWSGADKTGGLGYYNIFAADIVLTR
jgi:hypothetical protein